MDSATDKICQCLHFMYFVGGGGNPDLITLQQMEKLQNMT
jgi:precorrin-4 methylase